MLQVILVYQANSAGMRVGVTCKVSDIEGKPCSWKRGSVPSEKTGVDSRLVSTAAKAETLALPGKSQTLALVAF